MSDKKNDGNDEENNDLPILTDEEIENLDLKSKKTKKLMKQWQKFVKPMYDPGPVVGPVPPFNPYPMSDDKFVKLKDDSKTDSSQYDILLIVDDLATIRLLTSYFENKGYSCHGVLSGSKGLQELSRTSPKVILLNIILPDLSGYDIYKMIKSDKQYKEIPIFFLTTSSGSKVKNYYIGNGKNNLPFPYIFKPPSPPGDLGLSGQVQLRNIPKEEDIWDKLYCKNCGSIISEGQSICDVCGNKVI